MVRGYFNGPLKDILMDDLFVLVNYNSEYMIIVRVFIVKQLRLYLKITK